MGFSGFRFDHENTLLILLWVFCLVCVPPASSHRQVMTMLRDRNMLKKTLKFCSMSEFMRRRYDDQLWLKMHIREASSRLTTCNICCCLFQSGS